MCLLQKSPIFAGLFVKKTSNSGSLHIVTTSYQHDTSKTFWPDQLAKEPYFCRALSSKRPSNFREPIYRLLLISTWHVNSILTRSIRQRALFLQGSFVKEPYFCRALLSEIPIFAGLFCHSLLSKSPIFAGLFCHRLLSESPIFAGLLCQSFVKED